MFAKIGIFIFLGVLLFSTCFAENNSQDTSQKLFLPNQWKLRPAGIMLPLGYLPVSITLSPDNKYAAVVHSGIGTHEIRMFNLATHKQIEQTLIKNTWYGAAFTPDGKYFYVSAGGDHAIVRYDFKSGTLSNPTTFKLLNRPYPCGIALDKKGQYAYIAGQYGNCFLRLDLINPEHSQSDLAIFKDPHAYPYGVVLHPSGKTAYVSLWGGKAVAKVDLSNSSSSFQLIPTDSHPNEMVISKDGSRLYVACANSNAVNVIDTKIDKVTQKLNTALYPNMMPGSTPMGIALSSDEKIIIIANGDNNNLAVFDISDKKNAKSLGFIPTGWYPTAVALSPQKEIWVTNGKGNGSFPSMDGPKPGMDESNTQKIIGRFRGSLTIIPPLDDKTLTKYTKQAYLCSPLRADLLPVGYEKGNPIPAKVGDSSPIKYVVYIIKENRTYDQVFGDMPEGNGDPSLCLFGEEVTPNHHKIARNYVLLDNLYADAEISADGHEWSMGAYATDFVQKSSHGRSRGYKSEGTDPVNDSDVGHIWNRAQEAGITYRSYGEWVTGGGPEGKGITTDPVLQGHFDPFYSGYSMRVSDFDRVKEFRREFTEFEQNNNLPQLTIIRLPNDHTSGSSSGAKTPRAFLAENDLALGQLLEILSHSKFWKQLAVFVIEDDAQNGSDHVDCHRTVGLVISPYVKRNHVDHHLYSTTSFLRTIELILGLQPMSQFDSAALPLYDSFTSEPNFEPYNLLEARISLIDTNGPNAPMQRESALLNFEKEDSNDDILFNEIIWKSVKGADSEMPAPVRAAFVKSGTSQSHQDED